MFKTASISAVLRPAHRSSQPAHSRFDALSRTFEKSLHLRLSSLYPPSISLTWLSRAIDVLALTHADFEALFSDLPSPRPNKFVEAYLQDSVKVLNICNSISSDIEKLRRDRLLILLALRLLNLPADDLAKNLDRARDTLVKCKSCLAKNSDLHKTAKLVLDLAQKLNISPCGKIRSADKLLDRIIYAIGAVTVLVTGAATAFLDHMPDSFWNEIAGDFVWIEPLIKLQYAICIANRERFSGSRILPMKELQTVGNGVEKLVFSINCANEADIQRSCEDDIESLVRITEEYSNVLDDLLKGVNEFFRAVLCARKLLVQQFER